MVGWPSNGGYIINIVKSNIEANRKVFASQNVDKNTLYHRQRRKGQTIRPHVHPQNEKEEKLQR